MHLMRPTDVPDTGLICDLLWADPDKELHILHAWPIGVKHCQALPGHCWLGGERPWCFLHFRT